MCGLGYTGERIACEFKERFPDCEVSGSTRSEERAAALRARRPWLATSAVLDLDDAYVGLDAAGRRALARATHVVQTVAPIADGDADPLLALHGDDLRASASLRWCAYLSSTGVYGDELGGAWVDEAAPTRARAERVAAERAWLDLARSGSAPRQVLVFRLGGIYGPGRSPFRPRGRRRRGGGGNGAADARAAAAAAKPTNRVCVV